jgi:hypothetical protein
MRRKIRSWDKLLHPDLAACLFNPLSALLLMCSETNVNLFKFSIPAAPLSEIERSAISVIADHIKRRHGLLRWLRTEGE